MNVDDMNYENYGISPANMRIRNSGSHLELDIDEEQLCDEDKMPKISGGGLNGTFVFHKAVFHWGPEAHGSEHSKSSNYTPEQITS